MSSRARRVFGRLLRLAEHALATVGALFLIYVAFFEASTIVSPSMAPTLKGTSVDDGDWVLTEKLTYRLRSPRRWDVVTISRDDGLRMMKRVAGLPGERVAQPRNGPFLVNGKPAEMPKAVDLKFLRYGNLTEPEPVPCGDGYYVLGDDTRDSDDSRFIGPVARKRIVGRAWLIFWPLSRIGFVRG